MISTKQNEIDHLNCLASQRYLYSSAKNIMALQVFLNVFVIVFASIAVFIFNNGYIFNIKNDLSAPFALLSIVITLLNPLMFIPLINNKKELASKIQELFDTKVLSIEWNKINGDKPDINDIKIYSDKYKKIDPNYDKLKNWYSSLPKIDEVPSHIGKLICQRSNLWWNVSLRKKYISIIIFSSCIFSLIVIVFGFISNPSFKDIVLNIVTPLLPIFIFCIEQYKQNKESISNLERLKQELNSYWDDVINNHNESNSNILSRKIQDEIYKNRKDNQLIFDWIYKIHRNKEEEVMFYSIDRMVDEYKNSISTGSVST